jgi:hypothetical protein
MLDFPQDGHWNALGHDYAAQLIYSYLLDNELVTIIE